MRFTKSSTLAVCVVAICLLTGWTDFTDGVKSFGIPVYGGGGGGIPVSTTGEYFFVDSGSSGRRDAADRGGSPDRPFATLDFAIGRCVDDRGDVILLAPGHAETITAAGGVTVDVSGVSIIGIGEGDLRPTFTFTTAAAASWVVSESDILITNLRFVNGVDNQNHMIDLSGNDVTITYCDFTDSSTTSGLGFITADTADWDSDNLHVYRCFMIGYLDAAANMDSAVRIEKDNRNVRLEENVVYGDFDNAPLWVSAGGADSINAMFYGNKVTNLQTNKAAISVSGATATGSAFDNRLSTDTKASAFDTAALACAGNLWIDSDGTDDVEGVPVNNLESATGLGTYPTAADPAAGVSVAASIAQIAEATNKGTGTAIASNKSLVDAMGTDGNAFTDSGKATAASLAGILGTNVTKANSPFSSSTVESDADGSALERLEWIQVAGAGGLSYRGTCDAGMGASATSIVSAELAGFGDDYFNVDWEMLVLYNDDSPGAGPESTSCDIIDYVSATGTFTTDAFGSNVEASDIIVLMHVSVSGLFFSTMIGGKQTTGDTGSLSYLLSQYLADGDGDFAAGTALPSNTSLYDVVAHIRSLADGGTNAYPDTVANDSVFAYIMSDDDPAAVTSFDNSTDSLEAISDFVSGSQAYLDNFDSMHFGEHFTGTCTSGMGASATTIATDNLAGNLAGGDDYLNTGWVMTVVLNNNSHGAAPEGETRAITDYVDATATFTVNAFSANVEEDDLVFIHRQPEFGMMDDRWMYITHAETFDGSASYNLFTVSGDVEVKVWGDVTTDWTAHADTASVGTADSAALIIAATAANTIDIDDVWTSAAVADVAASPNTFIVGNGTTVTLTGTANIVGGVTNFHCYWRPLSAGGTVVSAP